MIDTGYVNENLPLIKKIADISNLEVGDNFLHSGYVIPQFMEYTPNLDFEPITSLDLKSCEPCNTWTFQSILKISSRYAKFLMRIDVSAIYDSIRKKIVNKAEWIKYPSKDNLYIRQLSNCPGLYLVYEKCKVSKHRKLSNQRALKKNKFTVESPNKPRVRKKSVGYKFLGYYIENFMFIKQNDTQIKKVITLKEYNVFSVELFSVESFVFDYYILYLSVKHNIKFEGTCFTLPKIILKNYMDVDVYEIFS